MNPSEILKSAKEVIAHPNQWIQGMSSADEDGDFADVLDAKCFCMYGALLKAKNVRASGRDDAVAESHRYLCQAVGISVGIGNWNDYTYRTHKEVMDAFDKAILLAEAKGE